jgi:phosphate starvation-inducible PhoH-like protein
MQIRSTKKTQKRMAVCKPSTPSVNDIEVSNRIKFDFRNPRQRFHVKSLRENQLTLVFGPAGTGKTYVSMAYAAQGLLRGEIKKLVLMRPAVALEGENHGFLPGDLWAKVSPWARPMLRKLGRFMGSQERILEMYKRGAIEILPFTTLRGDEFEDGTFVMLDEAQNCTPEQLRAFVTRIADGAKIVIAGDVSQNDLGEGTGLEYLGDLVEKYDIPCGVVDYRLEDVERGTLCAAFVRAYASEDAQLSVLTAAYNLLQAEPCGCG